MVSRAKIKELMNESTCSHNKDKKPGEGCEAVLSYSKKANIIVKIDNSEERKNLQDLSELELVDATFEVVDLLVKHALKS